jgi:hypothetical protein
MKKLEKLAPIALAFTLILAILSANAIQAPSCAV